MFIAQFIPDLLQLGIFPQYLHIKMLKSFIMEGCEGRQTHFPSRLDPTPAEAFLYMDPDMTGETVCLEY
uniref:Uncharacterized protein n=1 Tax=Arion vulgaris TaxID=1028688 RepID=A0A0B6Y2E2_9EUPU